MASPCYTRRNVAWIRFRSLFWVSMSCIQCKAWTTRIPGRSARSVFEVDFLHAELDWLQPRIDQHFYPGGVSAELRK
ncbi:hypothetical protein [Mesorhizobium sp. M0768]|uniref:hypothetical protein n=1 Tax=Mesorhizobium sp. M0768 TaxID=2956996 RepID=UPI0033352B6E